MLKHCINGITKSINVCNGECRLYKFSFLSHAEYSNTDKSTVGNLSAYKVEHFKICLFVVFYFSDHQKSDKALSKLDPVKSSRTVTYTSSIVTLVLLLQRRYLIELRCIHQYSTTGFYPMHNNLSKSTDFNYCDSTEIQGEQDRPTD